MGGKRLFSIVLLWCLLPSAIFGQEDSEPTDRHNILLICVDDLRPELGCYGVEYIQSPNIDRLAAAGVLYQRHYVQAPTCGASRFALLTGQYGGAGNGALFQRSKQIQAGKSVSPSLPAWFRSHGYQTVSVGKVSHHPGSLGGPDWNDPEQPEMPESWTKAHGPAGPWLHPRGWMHGLANGAIRKRASEMAVFESADVPDSGYPDGLTVPLALEELKRLGEEGKPFFLAVGLLRPHLPFGAPKRDFELYEHRELPQIASPERPEGQTTWHRSGEFRQYNLWGRDPNKDPEFALQVRRHYAACVTFADRQVGRILDQLHRSNLTDRTTVVLWGDHGWHLGEHAVWGKHTLFEESLRSPLIVCPAGALGPQGALGQTSERIVETIDLFPTLCQLTGLPRPDSLHGRPLPGLELQEEATESQGQALGYFSNARTLRTDRYRLILHNNGHRELYDHQEDRWETKNIATAQSTVADRLVEELELRWSKTH